MDDPFLAWLAGLAIFLTVDRAVVPRVVRIPAVFWSFVAVETGLAVAVAVRGFPGVESHLAVRWIVAAVLAMHVVQNLSRWDRARHDDAHRRP